jgi:tetratricopeptide (TPR) repeat protein
LAAQFHDALGTYYVDMKNNISSGMESLEMALQLARTAGDLNQQATILIQIAWITWMTGDYTASQSNAQEAQNISSLSGNLVNVAKALRLEAMGCGNQSDYKRAISLLHRARGLLELCGMSQGYLDKQAMISEAQVYLLKSEYGEARAIHTQIVQNTSVDQDPSTHAFSLLGIAEIDSIIGAEGSQVHQGLRKAEMLFKSIEYSIGVGYCQTIVADLSLRNGDPSTANDLFQQCLNKFWGKNVDAVSYCLERLADGRRWMVDNFAWRSTWTIVYLAHAQKSKENLHLHNALLFLGDIFLALGDEDTAHSLFIVGLDGFTVMDVHQNRAQCMLRLGDIAKNRGDHSHAIDLWKKAKPLFERSLQTKDLAGIEARLDAVNRNNPPALLNLQNLNVPKNVVEGNGIRTEKDLIVVAEGTGKGASVAA